MRQQLPRDLVRLRYDRRTKQWYPDVTNRTETWARFIARQLRRVLHWDSR